MLLEGHHEKTSLYFANLLSKFKNPVKPVGFILFYISNDLDSCAVVHKGFELVFRTLSNI